MATSVEQPVTEREQHPPPVTYDFDEALDLLADLADARDALLASAHLTVVLAIEAEIELLLRKLRMAEPEGDENGG